MQLLTEEKDDQETLQHELAFAAPEKNLDHCDPAQDSKSRIGNPVARDAEEEAGADRDEEGWPLVFGRGGVHNFDRGTSCSACKDVNSIASV